MMTPWLVVRSALALVFCAGVVALSVSHAAVPPRSAYQTALTDQQPSGPVLGPPPSYATSGPHYASSTPTAPTPTAQASATPTPSPTATPRPLVIPSGLESDAFSNVPGHIFFTDPQHNLEFVTGRHAHKQFTGNGASVAPAFSPDSHKLAWVLFERNYSDLEVTTLRFGQDGAVIPLTTTTLTEDQTPPPGTLTYAPPPGYQPSYELWANKPAWLPDGQHLLYLSDRPGFDPNDLSDVEMSVWEQGLSDPMVNAVRLTTPAAGTGGDDSPAWRPGDPTTFVYVNYGFEPSNLNVRQGVIEVAGALTGTQVMTGPSDLTPQGFTEYQPAWSPDGNYIAFSQDNAAHNGSDLLIIPFHAPGSLSDYNQARTVVSGAPYVVQPFWSPDGRYLGYLTGANGNFSLVIRRVYHHRDSLSFGPPIGVPQAGPVGADYRPTWGY